MPNQSGKIILVLILILLILGGAFYFILPVFKKEYTEQIPSPSLQPSENLEKSSKPSSLTRDYYSKNLKISLKVPENARIEEKFTDIIVSFEGGKVFQTRVGTNFSSAKEYFSDLKKKNNLSPKTYGETTINGRDVVLAILSDPNNKEKDQKTYFIYDNDAIYTFYTSDEALYPILDQIVQSFEYKP